MNNIVLNEKTTFIVIDLECNFSKDEKLIPRHEREIIEIGAVAVSSNFKILDEFSIFIKPEKHKKLTQDCIEFCGITQEQVDNADNLENALYKFEDWFLKYPNRIFGSWGNFDKFKMEAECSKYGLKSPFENHINLKEIFAEKQKLKRGIGVSRALGSCGLKFSGKAHRGVDDAINISRLLPYIVGDYEAKHKYTLHKKPFNKIKNKNTTINKTPK